MELLRSLLADVHIFYLLASENTLFLEMAVVTGSYDGSYARYARDRVDIIYQSSSLASCNILKDCLAPISLRYLV